MLLVIFIIVLFAVLIVWTWNNLYALSTKFKTLYEIIFILIMMIITLIIFYISKGSISYPNNDMIGYVRNELVLLFSPINGMVLMPYIAKKLSGIKEKNTDEEKTKRGIIIMLVIFVVILIIECIYLKKIQIGILKMLENLKQ